MTTITADDPGDRDDDESQPPLTFGRFVAEQLAADRKAGLRDLAERQTTPRKPAATKEENP